MRNLIQATLYPGIGVDRGSERLGRPRNRHAVRADRRALDRRRPARRGAQRPEASRHPLLSGPLHAGVEQVRQGGVRRCVHDRHRPRGAAPVASVSRSPPRSCGCIRSDYSSSPTIGCSARERRSSRVLSGEDPAAVAASWAGDEARWRLLRAKYLISYRRRGDVECRSCDSALLRPHVSRAGRASRTTDDAGHRHVEPDGQRHAGDSGDVCRSRLCQRARQRHQRRAARWRRRARRA